MCWTTSARVVVDAMHWDLVELIVVQSGIMKDWVVTDVPDSKYSLRYPQIADQYRSHKRHLRLSSWIEKHRIVGLIPVGVEKLD